MTLLSMPKYLFLPNMGFPAFSERFCKGSNVNFTEVYDKAAYSFLGSERFRWIKRFPKWFMNLRFDIHKKHSKLYHTTWKQRY